MHKLGDQAYQQAAAMRVHLLTTGFWQESGDDVIPETDLAVCTQVLPTACRNSLDSLRPYVAFGEEYARGSKGKQPRRPVRLLYRNGESGSQPGAWPEQLVHSPSTVHHSVQEYRGCVSLRFVKVAANVCNLCISQPLHTGTGVPRIDR